MRQRNGHFHKYFFYAVARVNLIIFNLKIGRYISVCVTSPIQNGRYEITSDRRTRRCTRCVWGVCMRLFSSFMHTHTSHGNGNACAMLCDCSACEIPELNADTPPPPSPVHTRPRKINLFCSSSIHTFHSYEIPLFASGRFIRRHESLDGFVIQIEIRCVTASENVFTLINDVKVLTRVLSFTTGTY